MVRQHAVQEPCPDEKFLCWGRNPPAGNDPPRGRGDAFPYRAGCAPTVRIGHTERPTPHKPAWPQRSPGDGQLDRRRRLGGKVFPRDEIDNARVMRLDDEIGTIEPGKKANLLLLGADPLKNVKAYDAIETVFLHGRPITRETLSARQAPAARTVTSINPGWPKTVNLSQNVSRLRSTICYISGLTQNWT